MDSVFCVCAQNHCIPVSFHSVSLSLLHSSHYGRIHFFSTAVVRSVHDSNAFIRSIKANQRNEVHFFLSHQLSFALELLNYVVDQINKINQSVIIYTINTATYIAVVNFSHDIRVRICYMGLLSKALCSHRFFLRSSSVLSVGTYHGRKLSVFISFCCCFWCFCFIIKSNWSLD